MFLWLTLFVSGCAPYSRQLSNAEELMSVSPEKSLAILDSIDDSHLLTERLQARYALLRSEALHKNYIDVSSDSLINVAVNYYARKNDHKGRMQAFYYKGIVLQNAKNYSYAAVNFEMARREAELISNDFYLGQVFRALANIMNDTNNNEEAISYERLAISSYKKAGAKEYELYANAALATALVNNKQYIEARLLIDSLLAKPQEKAFTDHCRLLKSEIIIESGGDDWLEAIKIYDDVDKDLFYLTDYAYYAFALDKNGLKELSDYYIEEAYNHSKDFADSATVAAFQARIENNRKHFGKAFSLMENACEVQDSITRVLLRQSISIAQRDFFREEAKKQEIQSLNTKRTLWFVAIILLLVICIIILLSIIRIRRIDAIAKEQMTRFAYEKQKGEKILMDNASILGALLSESLGHLDKLADEYFRADKEEERDIIFREYKKRRQHIQNDEALYSSLEADLNKYCDGIMNKLKDEVPSIKGDNLRIISLFFAGMPNITVQLIMGKNSLGSIEMTKSRLRKMIKDSHPCHESLFLELLRTKKR